LQGHPTVTRGLRPASGRWASRSMSTYWPPSGFRNFAAGRSGVAGPDAGGRSWASCLVRAVPLHRQPVGVAAERANIRPTSLLGPRQASAFRLDRAGRRGAGGLHRGPREQVPDTRVEWALAIFSAALEADGGTGWQLAAIAGPLRSGSTVPGRRHIVCSTATTTASPSIRGRHDDHDHDRTPATHRKGSAKPNVIPLMAMSLDGFITGKHSDAENPAGVDGLRLLVGAGHRSGAGSLRARGRGVRAEVAVGRYCTGKRTSQEVLTRAGVVPSGEMTWAACTSCAASGI
jgi:hypothetical protein